MPHRSVEHPDHVSGQDLVDYARLFGFNPDDSTSDQAIDHLKINGLIGNSGLRAVPHQHQPNVFRMEPAETTA